MSRATASWPSPELVSRLSHTMHPTPSKPTPTIRDLLSPPAWALGPDQGRGSASTPLNTHPLQESSLISVTPAGSPELPFLCCRFQSPHKHSSSAENVLCLTSGQTPFPGCSQDLLTRTHVHKHTGAHTHQRLFHQASILPTLPQSCHAWKWTSLLSSTPRPLAAPTGLACLPLQTLQGTGPCTKA